MEDRERERECVYGYACTHVCEHVVKGYLIMCINYVHKPLAQAPVSATIQTPKTADMTGLAVL